MPTSSVSHSDDDDRFPLLPLFVWLLIQLTALILGAADVEWSANYPSPAHLQSLGVMLVTQLVGATLLAPLLCSSRASTLAAALTLWPFICSAGFLSAASPNVITLAAFYVTTWILVLGVLFARRSSPLSPTTASALSLFVLADPILRYLGLEFAGRKSLEFGPISAIFQIIDGSATWRIAVAPFVVLLWALVVRAVHRHRT